MCLENWQTKFLHSLNRKLPDETSLLIFGLQPSNLKKISLFFKANNKRFLQAFLQNLWKVHKYSSGSQKNLQYR